ncbi:MAG: nucleotidyltransferase domain-containing protein [Firmicutes bacterium]|jgi:predicted nucleotidyltransferase|nr:nucleotidyltransferase domain-containing protein [Bacillota bacterium]
MADRQTQDMIKEIGRKYAEVLQRKVNLRGLYVYGSCAKGTYDNDSDIDIAVVADDFTGDMIEDTFTLMKLRRQVDMRIEPHPFLPSDFTEKNPMAREVMQTGIRIV